MGWAKKAVVFLWFVVVQNHNHYTTAKAIIFLVQERNLWYALLMMANEPKQRCRELLVHLVELVCVCGHFFILS